MIWQKPLWYHFAGALLLWSYKPNSKKKQNGASHTVIIDPNKEMLIVLILLVCNKQQLLPPQFYSPHLKVICLLIISWDESCTQKHRMVHQGHYYVYWLQVLVFSETCIDKLKHSQKTTVCFSTMWVILRVLSTTLFQDWGCFPLLHTLKSFSSSY